ncbi:MAG: serine/threonine protein kinase [Pirellulaceae bacterium]|nr:serine/threonine protein kinase [Pirellulaceae bacterium]
MDGLTPRDSRDQNDCPSRQALQALLQLGPADPYSSQLREHLLLCDDCQRTLDELTSSTTLASMRKALNERLTEPTTLAATKSQIKSLLIAAQLSGSNSEQNGDSEKVSGGVRRRDSSLIDARRDTTDDLPARETLHDDDSIESAPGKIPLKVGRFDILGVLGSGGMGTVYLGFDPQVNRKVAIKTIKNQTRELRERLKREAEAIGRINSENVVRLHGLDTDDNGDHFIVIEYIAGESLAARLARSKRLSPDEAASISLAAARGVAFAHQCGVLHRDIKPGNILLDQQGAVKVADFGLAAFTELSPRLTREHSVPGTPAYLSPELARGGRPSVASDVYSLGCVLHEALTGKQVIEGTPIEIIQRLANDQIPPLKSSPEKIAQPLVIIRNRALAADPKSRYPSVAAFAEDLERWLAGKPILAQPETFVERTRRIVKRRPRQVLAVVSLAIILSGMALYAGWMTRQNRLKKERLTIATSEISARTAEADRQRDLALKQLQESVLQTQDMLKDRAGTLELRKSLLVSAIDGLRQVAHTGNRSEVDRSTALAHLRLGQIQLALGDIAAGRKSLEAAREIAVKFPLESESDATSCRDLASILASLGETELSLRNHTAAKDYFEQALELRQIALTIDESNPQDSANYLMNLVRLGDIAKAVGNNDTAENYFREVTTQATDAFHKFPEVAVVKRSVLVAYNRLTVAAMNRGDAKTAREMATIWQQLAFELLQSDPLNLEYQYDQALVLAQSARIYGLEGDFSAAARLARESTAAYRTIANSEPDSALAQSRLAISLHVEADAWYATGDLDTAHDLWGDAASIHKDLFEQNPSNTRYALLGGESQMWQGFTDLSRGNVTAGLQSLDQACETFQAAEVGSNHDPSVVGPSDVVRQLTAQYHAAAELLAADKSARESAEPTVSAMCGYLLSRTERLGEAVALAEFWKDFQSTETSEMVNVHSLRAAIFTRAFAEDHNNAAHDWETQAIAALRTTLSANPAWLSIMRRSSDFLELRSSPAFQELLTAPSN